MRSRCRGIVMHVTTTLPDARVTECLGALNRTGTQPRTMNVLRRSAAPSVSMYRSWTTSAPLVAHGRHRHRVESRGNQRPPRSSRPAWQERPLDTRVVDSTVSTTRMRLEPPDAKVSARILWLDVAGALKPCAASQSCWSTRQQPPPFSARAANVQAFLTTVTASTGRLRHRPSASAGAIGSAPADDADLPAAIHAIPKNRERGIKSISSIACYVRTRRAGSCDVL